MNLNDHIFNINLLPIELGSFDVVVGMDWLTQIAHEGIVPSFGRKQESLRPHAATGGHDKAGGDVPADPMADITNGVFELWLLTLEKA